jgi:orotidine-5'-phosphate decarboxylase
MQDQIIIDDPRQQLIVALDVSSAAAARKIVAAVGDSASTRSACSFTPPWGAKK